MSRDCALIVFAKAPLPGFAKTRLAPVLGDDGAARLAARMLRETVRHAVLAQIGPVELCCAPDASHPALLGVAAEFGAALACQGNGDLGQRMQRAFESSLRTHRKVLLIGTDAPGLGPQQLREAARLLDQQPAVFGPATDGGYVLIGLSRPAPALFTDIAWSTDQVMVQTRERLRINNIGWAELPALADVDEARDLEHVPKEWLE